MKSSPSMDCITILFCNFALLTWYKDLGYPIRFLGHTGYGSIAWQLMEQLSMKDNFHWGQEAEAAFCELKKAMSHVPVLAIFLLPFHH